MELTELDPIIRELRRRRIAAGRSIASVGDAAGMSKGMLWEYEHGRHTPGLGILNRWAAALDVRLTLVAVECRGREWVHGTRLGRTHSSVRRHLLEDHVVDFVQVAQWSDGMVHGEHDALHGTTWAYAANLPHDEEK